MFSEAKYYAGFKTLRNRFRKYRYNELIRGSFEYLRVRTDSRVDYLKRQPWSVLLFVKWLFLDDNYPNSGGKIATKNELKHLLQLAFNLRKKLRMPNEYESLILYFRPTAYQQLPYQFGFEWRNLGRQSILFADLPDSHLIKTQFKELTGVSIQDFLDLSMALVVCSNEGKEIWLANNWSDSLRDEYRPEIIDNYLKSISKDINEVRSWLLENDDKRRCSTEHYEFTPFVNFPLLQVSDRHLVTENHALCRCIEHFIYDRLRKWNAAKFMDKFGAIFERYAKEALDYAEVRLSTEDQIMETLGPQGNQIDFIVHENGANIFIDTKGVEMNYKGRVTHSSSILKRNTKLSVLKAIKQAHDVIRKLTEKPDSGIPSRSDNYLLVVTYKDLYLGNGRSYYEIVAKKDMDKIYKEYKGLPVIPPENMYFITIDQLECACAMIKHSDFSFTEMIETAKAADKKPKNQKFDFYLHLASMRVEIKTPNYINDRQIKIIDKLKNATGKYEGKY